MLNKSESTKIKALQLHILNIVEAAGHGFHIINDILGWDCCFLVS
jgi:hypothetical protein